MNATNIVSWQRFVEAVDTLAIQLEGMKKNQPATVSELLFRGQPNSEWKLTTTLERAAPHVNSVHAYYIAAYGVKAQLESFTDTEWKLPTPPEHDDWLTEKKGAPRYFYYDTYAYYAYLRHHGFPSPLLDWTASPYVAAYFAMRDPPEEAVCVAVYVLLERTDKGKVINPDEPNIHCMGPIVKTHRRHFLQQSRYSACLQINEKEIPLLGVKYSCHEDVAARGTTGQDLLWKLVIPISERRDFLRRLDQMNINAFSLFGTEESLVESLAMRTFLTYRTYLPNEDDKKKTSE